MKTLQKPAADTAGTPLRPLFPILMTLFLIATAIPLPVCADETDTLAGTIWVLTDYRRVPGLDDGPAADYIASRLEEE